MTLTWTVDPLWGEFEERLNRFAARVRVNGRSHRVYVPNPSRLEELFVPGRQVLLDRKPARAPRRTPYDLVGVQLEGFLASVDSRVPNRVLTFGLEHGWFPFLEGYRIRRAEPAYGRSRLDFLLEGPNQQLLLLETKSCTLVREGVALFPDVPTTRGARHLRELQQFLEPQTRAMVLWVVQRPDARYLRPYCEVDPRFCQALQEAADAGVELRAVRLRVTPRELWVEQEIPVRLS